MNPRQRALVIIGGHEDRTGKKVILGEVARRTANSRIVVAAVASEMPDEMFAEYDRAFRALGIRHVNKLQIADREEAKDDARSKVLEEAGTVFFTGGDQLRITSQFGDTPAYQRVHDLYQRGGVVAGTSAGASVMCETMLVAGDGDQSHRLGDLLKLAPGLGLIDGVIIDQHFAERGRMGRLLAAVCQNPRNVGLGIDEDTAVIVEGGRRLLVIGSGAVHVVDAADVGFSNITADDPDATLSAHGVRLHVLAHGDYFDLADRRPGRLSPKAVEKLPEPDREEEPVGAGADDE